MESDTEGFLYPVIDEDLCVDCGRCLNTCLNVKFCNYQQKLYACWSNDNILRSRSSSGGIFSELAEYFLDKGGMVVGCSYSDDMYEAYHRIVSNKSDLDDLRRAKFVQSKVRSTMYTNKSKIN